MSVRNKICTGVFHFGYVVCLGEFRNCNLVLKNRVYGHNRQSQVEGLQKFKLSLLFALHPNVGGPVLLPKLFFVSDDIQPSKILLLFALVFRVCGI